MWSVCLLSVSHSLHSLLIGTETNATTVVQSEVSIHISEISRPLSPSLAPSSGSRRRTSQRIQSRVIKVQSGSVGRSPSNSVKSKKNDFLISRVSAAQQRQALPISSLKSSDTPTELEALANILFAYNLRSPLCPPDGKYMSPLFNLNDSLYGILYDSGLLSLYHSVFLIPDKHISQNPFSLFAIGEAGSKRLGVWKKTPDLFNLLAVEYSEPLRRCRYVGLRNLGATCYMNSYLQTLFMNLDFRSKLFAARQLQLLEEKSTKEESNAIVPELQMLFTALQSGMTQAADPGGVAKVRS